MIIPGQTTLIAAGVALAVGLSAGYFTGVRLTNNSRDAKELVVQREMQAKYEDAVSRANEVAGKLEEDKDRAERNYTALRSKADKVVDRPVYHSCKLDDDGLRLWNEASEGSAGPGGFDRDVRSTASAR